MPRKSRLDALPTDVTAWLQQRLRDAGFQGYVDIADELNGKLADHGLEPTSKSALGRYGKKIEERFLWVDRIAQSAVGVMNIVGQDMDVLSQATHAVGISMAQSEMLRMQEEGVDVDTLTKLMTASARATRVGLDLDRAVRDKRSKEAAALAQVRAAADQEEANLAREAGVGPERMAEVRRVIAGMAA